MFFTLSGGTGEHHNLRTMMDIIYGENCDENYDENYGENYASLLCHRLSAYVRHTEWGDR